MTLSSVQVKTKKFSVRYLVAQRSRLGHSQKDSFTYPKIIIFFISNLTLTLFRMEGGWGARTPPPPTPTPATTFPTVTYTNIGIKKNFLTFSFNPFATLV